MSWKGQRSRISFRNLLRNKKTVMIAVICCIVAVGAYAAYVGFHKPTSKAGNPEPYKGVLNYDENSGFSLVNFTGNSETAPSAQPIDLSKKVGNKGNGGEQSWGTPENPFMILELTPWQGFSEMGFMIEGCEPVDVFSKAGIYDKEKAAYYRENGEEALYDTYIGTTGGLSWANMGAVVKECFPEEDYPGKGTKKGDADYKYRWFHKTEQKTIRGYYECVKGLGEGYEGTFDITGLDEKGRPVFTRKDGGDFVWISLGGEAPNYEFHQQKENKRFKSGSTLEDVISAYAAGDREYTNRTDSEYYFMPNVYQVDEDGTIYQGDDLKPKSKFVHYNDFLRYTIRERTMKAVDEFCIVIKPVDPVEINAHPEWIDYTDLTYLHISSESGIANKHTKGATELQTFNKHLLTTTQTENSSFYTQGNDLTWEVAEKLYLKANGLAKYEYDKNGDITKTVYDYTGGSQFGYAPVIIGKTIIDTLNGGNNHNNPTYYMNYETMQIQKTIPSGNGNVRTETTGRNNNFYKFCLMDLLMDQDVFYDLFYRPLESTGQPIIQTQKVNGVETGVSVAQEGDAQYFWCPATFLPYVEKITQVYGWETKDGKKLKDKYGINQYSNAFMNFPGEAIIGYTYIYNSNNTIFVLGTSANLDRNGEYTGGAFEWFEEERDESYESLSTLDIIHFLLNYKKGIRTNDTDRQELKLRVLDIEPCSDYTYLTATALRALFPATKYKVSFKITHMTTAEVNGNKADLLANYDVVYVGTGVGKFNLAAGKTVYNDTKLDGRTYIHVGDTVESSTGEYRTSGDDLTSVKTGEITSFAKAGKVVILDTPIYNKTTSVVSKGTNVLNLAEKITKGDYKNVVSLDDLRISNSVDFLVGKAEIKMKSTPTSYQNAAAAESGDNHVAAIKQDEDGKYRLTFTFTMGYEASADETYAARFLIDRNGDGIVSENETGADTVDTWDVESASGSVFTPGSNKTPMLDEYDKPIVDEETGEEIYNETPLEYTISYIIPDDLDNGAIAWKFVLYATGNKAICYEWTGVSRYTGYTGTNSASTSVDKDEDGNKRKLIRILQVADDISGQANLEKELEKSGLFGTYAKAPNLKDYKFDITTIPLTSGTKVNKDDKVDFTKLDYVNAFQYAFGNKNTGKFKNRKFTAKKGSKDTEYYYPGEYIDNYDLYLFSCGNALEKADDSAGAVSFASWLVDQGYSVVFTSDSVYYDTTNQSAVSALKDSTGVSRFTASSKYAKKYVDTPYNQAGNEYTRNVANMEYTYYKAFINGDSGNKYKTYGNELWKDAKEKNTPTLGKTDGLSTTEGTQTNLGTVCVYPYTIDKDIKLTSTKAQDYQLNLENPFADVWYCLGQTNAKGTNNSYYTISPNDASNNYYLYSVENVFYCGVQLKEIPKDNVQEMQLFINTLIAASESAYVDPYVTVNSVYNRETKKYEVGPSKQNNNQAEGLDYYQKDAVNNPLTNQAMLDAGVDNFYESMITVGNFGKSFNYKLYQMPTNPTKDDNVIWSGKNLYDPDDANADGTESAELAGDEDEDEKEEEKEPDKVIKTTYFDASMTNWSGTTKIAAADLNAMQSSDELRIYYNCPEENLAQNKVTVNGVESRYEMGKDDRLFELAISINPWNTLSAYVYADDKAAEAHCISFTKGQLEEYITELAKKYNQQLTPNSEGDFVFYDITIKKAKDEPYEYGKGWGNYDCWRDGKQYFMNTKNPLKMNMIGIYQEDASAVNRNTVQSKVTTITKGALYPNAVNGKIQGDTHRIYFTPYAGTVNDDDVVALDIFFVRIDEKGNLIRTRILDKNGKPQRCPIAKVYREKKDANGNVTEYTQIENTDGVYSIENGGTLKSSTEYFITYDKKRANTEGFQYIEFEIFNEKKSSKTVLHLEPNANPTPEDVYLFNLD